MTRVGLLGLPINRSLSLFGLALGVRLACWLWFVGFGVRPLVDEEAYFRIAGGWADVLRSLAHLSLPTGSMLARAWSDAIWPPLHPFLLGLARALPGGDLPAARLFGVMAGAVTTVLVVHLTARLAGQHAARAAGLLHALYPSFVFFSVTLWSETLFILLLLALLGVVVRTVDSEADAPAVWILSLGCGSALLLLTRSAALPMLVGLLAWLAVRLPRRRRLRTVAGATLVLLLLVLPWSAASSWLAGRPIFLSSRDALNLALGNNPWTPPALGSAWDTEFRRRVLDAASDGRGFGKATEIARQEILGHPLRTAQRIVVRAGQLMGLDFFPLRHLATATLPPLPAWTLPAGLALQWLSLALLLFLTGVGVFGPERVRHRSLLLTLAIAGAAGPLATIAMPRLALPLLAVLLPVAGCGWTNLRHHSSGLRPSALAALTAGSLFLPGATVKLVIQHYLEPSSHYARALAPLADAVGATPLYTDLLACGPPQEAGALPRLAAVAPEGAHWMDAESLPISQRRPDASIRHLALAGAGIEHPISLRAGSGSVQVTITGSERWQRFLPVAGTALSCAWQGAAFPRLE